MSPSPSSRASTSGAAPALAAATLFFALLVILAVLDQVPALLLAGYALLSAATFLVFRADKSAAQDGERRTPESTLHILDLLGGWPGALVARQVFRHKTRKQPFRITFWATVVANCAALAWLALRDPVGLLG